jgi:hypothetical protein
MLLQQIKRLAADADMLWRDGSEEQARRTDAKITELDMQNEVRLNAACAQFEAFDQEARESGWLNASETSPWMEMIKAGKHAEPLRYCEFWELAARSAEGSDRCRKAGG